MPDKGVHLALVGCGAMGRAMLDGWLASGTGLFSKIDVISHGDRPSDVPQDVQWFSTVEDYAASGCRPDWLILAVKPYQVGAVCQGLAAVMERGCILSVAAGCSVASIARYFSDQLCVFRAMPNLPASIHQGVTGLFAPEDVGEREKRMAEVLMSSLGVVCWVDEEVQLHAVTAVSGSGPAYLFHLCHLLKEEGVRLGLPEEAAVSLAVEMLAGSSLLLRSSGEAAQVLRDRVAVPGGTTEAAIKAFDAGGLQDLVRQALSAAVSRSVEIEAENSHSSLE